MIESIKTVFYVLRFMLFYCVLALVPLLILLGVAELMGSVENPVLVLFGFLFLCMFVHMLVGIILRKKRDAIGNNGEQKVQRILS